MVSRTVRRASSAVSVDFPEMDLRLEFKASPIMGAVARKMATAQRRNLRRGVTPTGKAIKPPKDGGKPLRRSGELLKSIKGRAVKDRGQILAIVWATGERGDLGASLRNRNAGLLGVQIWGRASEKARPRNPTLMALSKDLRKVASQELAKQFQKAFTKGKARIVKGDASSLDGLAKSAFGAGR